MNDSEIKLLADERLARLQEIAHIIEGVDQRAMAADGPVSQTLQEMKQEELQKIYDLAVST